MYRLKRNGHDSANFEMVFEEYSKLMEQGNSVDRRNKAAALRAFERLIASFLISYVDPRFVDLLLAEHTVSSDHAVAVHQLLSTQSASNRLQ